MARGTPEERRKRLAQLERQEKARNALKWSSIAAVAIVLVAGAAYGISKLPKQPQQVHWHAKYRVYVDGQLVSFANPRFDGMKYEEAHIHAPEYDTIHNEGLEGRGTLGRFFEFQLGGKLSDTEIVLPQGSSIPGDYKANDTARVQILMSNQARGKDWAPIASNYAGTEFHDGDRYLIVYGDPTAEQLAQFEAQYPDFDPSKQGKTMPPSPTQVA